MLAQNCTVAISDIAQEGIKISSDLQHVPRVILHSFPSFVLASMKQFYSDPKTVEQAVVQKDFRILVVKEFHVRVYIKAPFPQDNDRLFVDRLLKIFQEFVE